jgi:DNA/RNA endonuclease YhcR with UshA esterase domain
LGGCKNIFSSLVPDSFMELNILEKFKARTSLILIVCFLCSLLGIFLIYIAALNTKPTKMKLDDINFELVGRVISTEGKIVSKNLHPAGHLFLTIEENNARIQVPIFASLISKLNEAGVSIKDFEIGKKLQVTGLVSEYKEQLQIVPRKVEDIKIK